ncbi:hypothetical protein P7H17_23660 [Paenibacillus larvae]|nr:hypothetical protein [Paenibacillus larvae]MDT2288442.1 hypothetical protein [Paenibacillus larvae]
MPRQRRTFDRFQETNGPTTRMEIKSSYCNEYELEAFGIESPDQAISQDPLRRITVL